MRTSKKCMAAARRAAPSATPSKSTTLQCREILVFLTLTRSLDFTRVLVAVGYAIFEHLLFSLQCIPH